MIKKIHFNILFLIAITPLWVTKVNFTSKEYLLLAFLITVIFLLNLFLLHFIKVEKINFFFLLYLSVVFTWGIDNQLSLYNEVILPEKPFFIKTFGNIYLAAILLLIIIFSLIFLIIKKLQQKGIIILTFFLVSISLFSIFDNSKNSNQILFFDKSTKDIAVNKTTLILILDEMSGLNSLESKTTEGIEFDNAAIALAKKYKFNIYSNIYTESRTTVISIPLFLNPNYNSSNASDLTIHTKTFYSENDMIQNKIFNLFKSVSVYQGMHINFCNNKNVKKCDQYNPFKDNKFIYGFKDTFTTKIVSTWRIFGSATSQVVWRILMHYRLIDYTGTPNGEKASFAELLKKIKSDILLDKFDLIFSHSLVPHKPYGFNKNCEYDGSNALGNYGGKMQIEEHTLKHNIDRTCTIRLLDTFFQELKNENGFKNLDVFVFSDHGSRNQINDPESNLNSFFMYKNAKTNFIKINEKKISQKEFHNLIIN